MFVGVCESVKGNRNKEVRNSEKHETEAHTNSQTAQTSLCGNDGRTCDRHCHKFRGVFAGGRGRRAAGDSRRGISRESDAHITGLLPDEPYFTLTDEEKGRSLRLIHRDSKAASMHGNTMSVVEGQMNQVRNQQSLLELTVTGMKVV